MIRLTTAMAVAVLASGCADDVSGGGTEGDTDDGTATAGDDVGDEAPDGTADGAGCDGPFALECPSDVTAECVGPTTPVELDDPSPACNAWTVTRAGDTEFAVGDNRVEYTLEGSGMSESCMTTVTITDATPPQVICPPMEVLVKTSVDDVVSPPAATVQDLCSDGLEAVADVTELPTGTTTVEYSATDAADNVGTCAVELAVVEVFAPSNFALVDGTLLESGETEVTFGWEPFESTFAAGVRLESADAPEGPWTEVATLGVEADLHTLVLDQDAAYYRLVTLSGAGEGGATPAVRAFRISDELYDLRDVPVPGIPFATTLYGVVRHPTSLDEGPFPLVAMLHGNHGNCRDAPNDPFDYCSTSQDHECGFGAFTTPNAEGMSYLAETLAAQGLVSVSISGNAMNCRDGFIIERSQLIGEHLRRWRDWNAGDGELANLFQGAVDMTRVGLLGHSRGGDAVSNVPGVLAASPIDGVEVRSIFALAPTDFQQVEVRDTNLAVLLPSCDGDVFDLVGKEHYDRSSGFADGVHHSQLFFIGANHNFFNTEWRISDWEFQPNDSFCQPDDNFLMQVQQHGLSALAGPWFQSTLNDEAPVAYQRAEADAPGYYDTYTGDALDWRWSYSADERTVIDDFEGLTSPAMNALGGPNTFEDWLVAERCIAQNCDPSFLHPHWAMRLLYDEDNVLPIARLQVGSLDVSSAGFLSFRVVSRVSSLNTGLTTQDFVIRVIDDGGAEVELLLSDVKEIRHLYGQNQLNEILETVRVPISMLTAANAALNVNALATLEFEMTTMPTGSVIVTDIELAP